MANEKVHICLGKKDSLVTGDKVYKSSNDWDLTEKEIEKACTELGETEERKRKCLQELKRRLSKEGQYRMDDPFLLCFLRVRKYNCEKAYQNIKNYSNLRKKKTEFYGIPSKQSALLNGFNCLPYADEEGKIIFWMDVESWDPQQMSFEETMHPIYAVCDIASMNPKCQVNGVIGIWDMKGLSAKHMSEVLWKNRLITFISIGYFFLPWRIKKVIVTNSNRLTRFLYSLIRPLLSKKIKERVFLLGSDLSELHQHVNPAILPKKLGGALEDDFCQDPKQILNNIQYLEYDRSFTGD